MMCNEIKWFSASVQYGLCTFLVFAIQVCCICPAYGESPLLLSLSDAVNKALLNNKNILAAFHENEAASGAKLEAYSAYLPQFSIQSQSAKTESDRYTSPFQEAGFSGQIYDNKIEASQLIFDRSVISNIFRAGLKKQAAEMLLTGQRLQTVYETVNLYIEILLAREIIDVHHQRLELAEKQLHIARSKFQAGYQINTDVARAQLTQASARRDINLANVAMERAKVALNKIMGLPVELRHGVASGYLMGFDPSAMPEVESNVDALFAIAEKQNPKIKIADLLVQEKEEILNMAKGEFYPRIYTSGNWGFYDIDKMDFEDEEWTAQLVVEIPIFEGGRRFGKVKRTYETLNAEQKRYEFVVLDIHGNVEEALFVMKEERNNYRIAVQAESVAQKNYQVFFDRYESGLAESLDLMQALTELVGAQTEVVMARYSYLRGMVQLLSSLGALPLEREIYLNESWLYIEKVIEPET